MSTAPLDLKSLRINGTDPERTWVDLAQAVAETGIEMTETLTGASTVTVNVVDTGRKLLRHPIVKTRALLTLDGAEFELCRVSTTGSRVILTFEDRAVAVLRRRNKPKKIGPNKMTRAQFCQMLIREESWIRTEIAPGRKSLVELARGTFDSTSNQAADTTEPENTWDCINRIMGEIGWRVVATRGTVILAPDSYLLTRGAAYAVKENTSGVDEISMDWDIGMPCASASFPCRTGFGDLRIASRVTLSGMGPGDGAWLVSSVRRSPYTFSANVSLIRAQPVLSEPTASTSSGSSSGASTSSGTGSSSSASSFLAAATALIGKDYEWGKAGPSQFDCSGLVVYAAKKTLGVTLPHQSGAIYSTLAGKGKSVSVKTALNTPGALLFINAHHVAISVGDGKNVVEALNESKGVVQSSAAGRGWDKAATL